MRKQQLARIAVLVGYVAGFVGGFVVCVVVIFVAFNLALGRGKFYLRVVN